VPTIVLEPQNPNDLTPEKLQSLVDALKAASREVSVEFAHREQRGYGVTWWEVLNVWIKDPAVVGGVAGAASAKVVEKLVEVVIDWLKRRHSDKATKKRPKIVTILDHEGNVLKSVELQADSPMVDKTAEKRSEPRRKPPVAEQ
jgi:hypothetical protein